MLCEIVTLPETMLRPGTLARMVAMQDVAWINSASGGHCNPTSHVATQRKSATRPDRPPLGEYTLAPRIHLDGVGCG